MAEKLLFQSGLICVVWEMAVKLPIFKIRAREIVDLQGFTKFALWHSSPCDCSDIPINHFKVLISLLTVI